MGTIKWISGIIFVLYCYVLTPSAFRWGYMCNSVMLRRRKILKRVYIYIYIYIYIYKLNLLPGSCRGFEKTTFRIVATRFAAVLKRHTMLSWPIKVTSRRKYLKKNNENSYDFFESTRFDNGTLPFTYKLTVFRLELVPQRQLLSHCLPSKSTWGIQQDAGSIPWSLHPSLWRLILHIGRINYTNAS